MEFWKDPLKVAADWLGGIFAGWGMNEIASNILLGFLGVLILLSILMVLDIALVWVERKVVSRFQSRIGPNRVGPFGLIQPFADIIKLLIKEDITPQGADKWVYNLAPILSMMSVLVLWAVFPLAPEILGVDLNVGALLKDGTVLKQEWTHHTHTIVEGRVERMEIPARDGAILSSVEL